MNKTRKHVTQGGIWYFLVPFIYRALLYLFITQRGTRGYMFVNLCMTRYLLLCGRYKTEFVLYTNISLDHHWWVQLKNCSYLNLWAKSKNIYLDWCNVNCYCTSTFFARLRGANYIFPLKKKKLSRKWGMNVLKQFRVLWMNVLFCCTKIKHYNSASKGIN